MRIRAEHGAIETSRRQFVESTRRGSWKRSRQEGQERKRKEQIPTIACNVVHQGRGHTLPPSVTGGSWNANTTWNHVMKEKGPSFIPGREIPDEVRITAWEFMGQQIPQNYGTFVFGTPLCNEYLAETFTLVAVTLFGTPFATNCYSTSSPAQAQVLACGRGFHSSVG